MAEWETAVGMPNSGFKCLQRAQSGQSHLRNDYRWNVGNPRKDIRPLAKPIETLKVGRGLLLRMSSSKPALSVVHCCNRRRYNSWAFQKRLSRMQQEDVSKPIADIIPRRRITPANWSTKNV